MKQSTSTPSIATSFENSSSIALTSIIDAKINHYENTPFAQVFFQGILIALINFKGKILYSGAKCNLLLNKVSSTLNGSNLLQFLKQDHQHYQLLFQFFTQNNNSTSPSSHPLSCLSPTSTTFIDYNNNELFNEIFRQKYYETRFGDQITLEFNQNFHYTSSFHNNNNNNNNSNNNKETNHSSTVLGLLSLSNLQNNLNQTEELSFNDAFE